MNIMTKKLQAGRGLPVSYIGLALQFTGVYERFISYLEDDLSLELVQKPASQVQIDISSTSFDEMETAISGLVFAAGSTGHAADNDTGKIPGKVTGNNKGQEDECQMLVEISGPMAKCIIKTKLGDTYEGQSVFSLFDSLLIQPLAEIVLGGLRVLSDGVIEADIISRAVNMASLQDIKLSRRDQWVKLHFPIWLQDNKNPKKTIKKGKADNKTDAALYLSLYVARPIAERLIAMVPKNEIQPGVDLTDPWSCHMHDIVLGAKRSLEIVIEDLTLSVASCTRLESGQVIALPGASHERLKIKTRAPGGQIVLAAATLGVFKANKAVKLNEDINPAFISDLGNIAHNK